MLALPTLSTQTTFYSFDQSLYLPSSVAHDANTRLRSPDITPSKSPSSMRQHSSASLLTSHVEIERTE